ncbi:MAG: hypothetical protein NT067_06430 [Candidatus Diapherotrites archaeon]|nr:hypothetical protein [Candidatus Diapherotrites archaeon]
MKKMLLAFGILFMLNAGIAFGTTQNFQLLSYAPRVDFDVPKIIENQIKPISEAFGLEIDTTQFSNMQTNQIILTLDLAMPQSNLERIDYSIIRDGGELNEKDATVEVGDIIRYEVQGELGEQGNDWIAQGGTTDSPPIQMLTAEQYNALYPQLEQKFKARYPCANASEYDKYCYYYYNGQGGEVPAFQTEKTQFNKTTSTYTAENGYLAYVVPIFDGKKAGIQVFCNTSMDSYAADCKQGEAGTIECTAKQAGILPTEITPATYCMAFVDKVIIGNEAAQADWFYGQQLDPTHSPYSPHSQVQVIPKGKKAPIADFTCKKAETPGPYPAYLNYITLECDASLSKDPDGTIEEYEWVGGGAQYFEWAGSLVREIGEKTAQIVCYGKQSKVPITLRVTDNDGIYSEITKTIDPNNPNPQPPLTFTADYTNQKVLLTLENCPEGTTQANANIYLLGENGEPENAVLEKQPIQCKKTTEISGITAKGTYQATATIGGEEKTAIFTVS